MLDTMGTLNLPTYTAVKGTGGMRLLFSWEKTSMGMQHIVVKMTEHFVEARELYITY